MVEKISDEEATQINELRTTVPGLKKEHFDDGFVLRWLRASGKDVKQTEISLKRHLIFRKAWGVDEVHNWSPPEVCRKYYGYGYPTCDKEGHPVLLSLFGLMDVEGLIKSISSIDYIRTSIKHLEEGMVLAKKSAEKKGEPYGQLIMVIDLNGLSTPHYTYKPFTYSYLTLLAVFQENYPLAFKKFLVIQAPSIAQYAYTLLTPVLSESMQSMIEMLPADWQDKLFELIDPKQWPSFWGGQMKDPNGDEKCPSKISYTEGPILESYYVDDKMDGSDTVTVYAGDKHFLNFDVKTPNSQLYFKFRTNGEDIGFAIYYDVNGEKTDMEPVFPYIRLECSVVPGEGSINCEKAGKYVVEFDNYYSWFSAKEMVYDLKVI